MSSCSNQWNGANYTCQIIYDYNKMKYDRETIRSEYNLNGDKVDYVYLNGEFLKLILRISLNL